MPQQSKNKCSFEFRYKAHRICCLFIMILIVGLATGETVFAEPITGTTNENYRKSLEAKYGFRIIIDDSVKQKDSFYTSPVSVSDVELKVLKDIESAFAMLPDGFVKEVNDYFKKKGFSPKISILYGNFTDGSEAVGRFYSSDISIHIVEGGNGLILNLLHEFGHEVEWCLAQKNKTSDLKNYFIAQNKNGPYQYNENYKRLEDIVLESNYYDFYISQYSSKNFNEDFAEIFSYGITQPRYISSYGNGMEKAIHLKMKRMSQVLCGEFKTLKDSKFLLNCLPDAPAQWAHSSIINAKEKGIVPWKIYGLNTYDLTRYDAALILQPFLYQYVDEDVLYRRAGVEKDAFGERFVYDVVDAEDIYLLTSLPIMTVYDNHFNPYKKIQRQEAAIIFARMAENLGIRQETETAGAFNDFDKIADWAKDYVKLSSSLQIMNGDSKNNFNPEKNITYQEFYICLLKIAELKEKYDRENNDGYTPKSYIQSFDGTTLSQNGWILYYGRCGEQMNGLTGKGELHWENGDWYKGDFVDGNFHGKGELHWTNGNWYEGDFRNDERTGQGKYYWAQGDWYEGDFKNGERTGYGKHYWADGTWYEGGFVNGELHGEGEIHWADGTWEEVEN